MRCRLLLLPLLLISCLLLAAAAQFKPGPPAAPKDLRDVGIAGDGESDNTAVIQRAVDNGLGSIHFPKGVYKITKPIVINLAKTGFTSITADGTARLVMAGRGPALKFVGTHLKGTAAPKSVEPKVWTSERMPVVAGLEIVGAHAEADGIEASGTMKLTIDRVAIRECRHGIRLVE